jgi:hypothetical protein
MEMAAQTDSQGRARPQTSYVVARASSPKYPRDQTNTQTNPPTSPYAGAPATLHIGPASHIYHAPRALLPATLLQCHEWIDPAAHAPDIALPDVDDNSAHILLHYLHTGAYESLATSARTPAEEARVEFARALAAYAVAARYEIRGLGLLARREAVAWGVGLSVFEAVGLLEGVFARVCDGEGGWVREWIREKCRVAFEADYERFARMDVFDGVGDVALYRWLMKCLVELLSERVALLDRVGQSAAELAQTGDRSVAVEGVAIQVSQVPTEPPTPAREFETEPTTPAGELYLDDDSIVAAITDAPSVPRKPESGVSYGAWDSRFRNGVPAAADSETGLDFDALNAALAAQQLEEDSRTDTDVERKGCFASVTERKKNKKNKTKKVVFHEDALMAQKEMDMIVDARIQQLNEEAAELARLEEEEAELARMEAEEAELAELEEAELVRLVEEEALAQLAAEAGHAQFDEEEVETEAEPISEQELESVLEQESVLGSESIIEPEQQPRLQQEQEATPEPLAIAEPSPTLENPFAGLTFKEKRKLAKKLKKEAVAEKEAAESAQAQTTQEQPSTNVPTTPNPPTHRAFESPIPAPENQFTGLARLQKLKLLKKMVSGKKSTASR